MTFYEAVGLLYLKVQAGEGLDLIELKEIKAALPSSESELPLDLLQDVTEWVIEHGLPSL
jgi:hypothetical protein